MAQQAIALVIFACCLPAIYCAALKEQEVLESAAPSVEISDIYQDQVRFTPFVC